MRKRRIVEERRYIYEEVDDSPRRKPQRPTRRELRAQRERDGWGLTSQRNPRGFDSPMATEIPDFDNRRGHFLEHLDHGGHEFEPEEFA
jgi:hypothetical protein